MAHDTPSAPDRTLRVLVADDHDLIRGGLVTLLRGAPGFDVAGEAASGEEAVRISEATTPDVVLMDVRMPGAGGIAATRRILAAGGDQPPRVLILTTFDLDEYVYEALRAGASGFLLKDTPSRRLLSAIATVAGGEMLYRCFSCRFFSTDFTHLPALRDLRTAKAEQLARLQAGYGTVLRRGPLADANLLLLTEEISQLDQLIRKCETDLTSLTDDEHRRVEQWLDQRQRYATLIPIEALTAQKQKLDQPTFDPAGVDNGPARPR